jgi:hypothetical protein
MTKNRKGYMSWVSKDGVIPGTCEVTLVDGRRSVESVEWRRLIVLIE